MGITEDKILEAGFDHPCKATCSGWEQGRLRGEHESVEKIKVLSEKLFELSAEIMSLSALYEPHYDCKESGFACDYRNNVEDLCPCLVAAKYDPEWAKKHGTQP
jgi:hypothetical protein